MPACRPLFHHTQGHTQGHIAFPADRFLQTQSVFSMRRTSTRWWRAALALFFMLPLIAATAAAQDNYLAHVEKENLDTFIADISATGGNINNVIQLDGTAVVCFSGDRQVKAFARRHRAASNVANDPNIAWITPDIQAVIGAGETFNNPPNSGDDDFFFDLQWGHDAINAPESWRKRRGAGVRVAVLDSGIDAEHPDLAPNLNGVLSKSFVPGEDWNIQPGLGFNHGTHVAGTIAAADNGFGTIGVAPEVELVALKVLSEFTGSGAFSWIVEAVVYAADNDVDIANLSLGAIFPKGGSAGADAKALKEILDAVGAYANDRGTMLIASAGNNGLNVDDCCVVLPSGSKHFLSVSATTPVGWALNPATDMDVPASYSNYGTKHVDFSGPGGDALYAGGESCTVGGITQPCWVFDLVFSTINEGWGWSAGTSMAAPHVTGVAALIKSWKKGATPVQIKNMLKASADKLGDTPGKDAFFGRGRVDAQAALGLWRTKDNGVEATDALITNAGFETETPETFAIEQNYPNPFNPTTAINFHLAEQADVHVAVYDMMGRQIATLVSQSMVAGSYTTSWNGKDSAGQSVASGVYLYKIVAGNFTASRVMTLLK